MLTATLLPKALKLQQEESIDVWVQASWIPGAHVVDQNCLLGKRKLMYFCFKNTTTAVGILSFCLLFFHKWSNSQYLFFFFFKLWFIISLSSVQQSCRESLGVLLPNSGASYWRRYTYRAPALPVLQAPCRHSGTHPSSSGPVEAPGHSS